MNKIALIVVGHFRNYNYDNIYNSIISPILEEKVQKNSITIDKYSIDTFISTWDTLGFRHQGSMIKSEKLNINDVINDFNPLVIDIEQENRQFFLDNYKSNNITSLSFSETCGDAVSSYYKLYRCLELVRNYEKNFNIKYDIIIRIRPDIVYKNPIKLEMINKGVIYMPEWHGKYESVTKQIMDHFYYGHRDTMMNLGNIYLCLNDYIKNNKILHTSEWFLFYFIFSHKIRLERFKSNYSVLMVDCVEEVV